MLARVVEEAKLRWTEALGAGDIRLAMLAGVNVRIGNLPGDRLGVTLGHDIYIDSDAAGRGWQEQSGTMDLLSVVMHEFGHVLGFDHDDSDTGSVMSATLDAGPRVISTDSAITLLATSPESANDHHHALTLTVSTPNARAEVSQALLARADDVRTLGSVESHKLSLPGVSAVVDHGRSYAAPAGRSEASAYANASESERTRRTRTPEAVEATRVEQETILLLDDSADAMALLESLLAEFARKPGKLGTSPVILLAATPPTR
jgi:hypothetical protein